MLDYVYCLPTFFVKKTGHSSVRPSVCSSAILFPYNKSAQNCRILTKLVFVCDRFPDDEKKKEMLSRMKEEKNLRGQGQLNEMEGLVGPKSRVSVYF